MLSEAGLLGSSFSQEEASSCFYFFTFSQESLIRVVLCLRANARSKQGLFETFLPFPFSLSHRKNCIQYDNFSYCCYFCCTLFLKIHCRIFCVLHYKKSKLRILLRSAPLLALQRGLSQAHSFVLYFASCRLCWQLISSTANLQTLIVKTRLRYV